MAKDSIISLCDSCLHRTHEYIESWVHLRIQVTLNLNDAESKNKLNKIKKLFCLQLLMYSLDFLDSWIFNDDLTKIITNICRLIHSIYFVANNSCDYKTRRIWDFDKIQLLPFCRNVNCFINNHLIFCYSHIYSMR